MRGTCTAGELGSCFRNQRGVRVWMVSSSKQIDNGRLCVMTSMIGVVGLTSMRYWSHAEQQEWRFHRAGEYTSAVKHSEDIGIETQFRRNCDVNAELVLRLLDWRIKINVLKTEMWEWAIILSEANDPCSFSNDFAPGCFCDHRQPDTLQKLSAWVKDCATRTHVLVDEPQWSQKPNNGILC